MQALRACGSTLSLHRTGPVLSELKTAKLVGSLRGGALSFAFLDTFDIVLPTMVNHMRHTRSHTANRRSHHALKTPVLAVCSNCGAQHRPHHMCLECGFYKGRQVLDLALQKKKRTERMQAKREAIRSMTASEAEAVSKEAPKEESK